MSRSFAFVFMVFCACSFAQTITFDGNTITNPQTGCRCVAAGSCATNTNPGFDVRIVNQGGSNINNGNNNNMNCPAGQLWCCAGSSGGLTDATCGIRKITNSPAQPTGTAKYGSYPWQAALLTPANVYIGSGVLLNANYVLTAAHKVQPYPNRDFKVRLGEWNGQQNVETYPYQEFNPAQVITHPSFMSSNLQNDVALIRLDRAVPISTSPNINCAPIATAVPPVGTRCWVAGWGKNAFGPTGNYQSLMKEVDVPIVDQGNCEARMRTTRLGQFFNLDRTSFMCAGGETGKDACTGDGGAPLVCQSSTGQWQVVGIVAWGIGCATSEVPGVYVNVPNYRAWINQQMGVSR